MSAENFNQLARHLGHIFECVSYGNENNVSIECVTCSEVILDYERVA